MGNCPCCSIEHVIFGKHLTELVQNRLNYFELRLKLKKNISVNANLRDKII